MATHSSILVWRIPWTEETGGPTVPFPPGESHGQRSLEGYSPWGHKESDTTEQVFTYIQLHIFTCNYILAVP